ncbi:biliverdin-producing heme oxygenase [Aquincola sp. MAHUQ-54]|uniref:Biliverdin-producing heme oxygenase n=1 Tax=Aquincola agrisoli TaxID=3119538 RepID=A0AAW9Q9P7_9BURK
MSPTPDAPRPLHARLRSATADDHGQLENLLDLLAEPLSYIRYVAVLMRFHGFHRVWEPALARVLQDEAFLQPRQRLPLIEQDLRELDIDDLDIEALPIVPEAAQLCRTEAAALGSLYVMEGSTLGGRMISRRLAESADWSPPQGLRYFNPYGDATGERWRETLARLEAAPPEHHAAIVAGAQATFALLLAWMAPAVTPAAGGTDDVPSEWGVAV